MIRRLIAAGIAAVALLLGALSATPVRAHAALIGSDPADGSLLARVPGVIVLTFNEPVTPIAFRLLDSRGESTDLTAAARVNGNAVVIGPPRASIAAGTSALTWRVVSADGHPVSGTLVFSVGHVSAGSATADASDPAVAFALWLARLLLYCGLFAGAGGSFFLAWLAGHQHRTPALDRVLLLLIATGLVAAVVSLGLHGLDVLGAPLPALLTPAPWAASVATSYGLSIALALVTLLGAAFPVLPGRESLDKPVSGAALLGVGATLAVSGHAVDTPQNLAWFAVLVHGVAVAFWVGALVPLAMILRSKKPLATQVLRRFARTVPYAIASLVGAGTLLALAELTAISDLWTTGYGLILSAKLAVVAVLLALALANRAWLTPAIGAGKPQARAWMVRAIRGEVALVVAVFALVAAWRLVPPPQAVVEGAPRPAFAHIMQSSTMANLTITPGSPGPVGVSILLLDDQGRPLAPLEVRLSLANPAMGIEPIVRMARQIGDGVFEVTGLLLPVGGTWEAKVTAVVSDFSQVELSGPIAIPTAGR
jgi:copper transport protein